MEARIVLTEKLVLSAKGISGMQTILIGHCHIDGIDKKVSNYCSCRTFYVIQYYKP